MRSGLDHPGAVPVALAGSVTVVDGFVGILCPLAR